MNTRNPGEPPGADRDHGGEIKVKKPRTLRAYVDGAQCAGCGLCADRCFQGAITLDGIAVIDRDICTGCGKCVDACPLGALSLR